MEQVNIFWFRRDLRLQDNAGLFHALNAGLRVVPVFIFDKDILCNLHAKDLRVDFIHQVLSGLQSQFASYNSSLTVLHDEPIQAFKHLVKQYAVQNVFANHDYEAYAQRRDTQIADFLGTQGIDFLTFKDQVIFEKNEIVKGDGSPYTVFTPYAKTWKKELEKQNLPSFPSEKLLHKLLPKVSAVLPSLTELGFEKTSMVFHEPKINEEIVEHYHKTRDIPGLEGTSKMSVHLRFGTISIRKLVSLALLKNEKFLNELIWRDFYQCILWHFPYVINRSFKVRYDNILWRNSEEDFLKWCTGQTGYPIVDAGMRELNATGWMHNRVRMVVASFLSKHLLIDWRWGEAYFAEKLLDFDLASNNGGWQWAAGCGVDAAPYFRIFNPSTQTKKFDPDFRYIRRWVPELDTLNYPNPIINHEFARKRCLETFKQALQ